MFEITLKVTKFWKISLLYLELFCYVKNILEIFKYIWPSQNLITSVGKSDEKWFRSFIWRSNENRKIPSEIYPPFTDSVQLNAGLSLQLFGTNQAQVYVKNFDEFPATYKEKMFKSPESKPIAHLVKTEMNIVNKIANSATDEVVATSSNDEKTIGK